MSNSVAPIVVAATALLPLPAGAQAPIDEKLASFLRLVIKLDDAQLKAVAEGAPVTAPLPVPDADEKRETAAFGIVSLRSPKEAFVKMLQQDFASLRKSPVVKAAGLFSTPAKPQDLASFEPDAKDFEAIQECVKGDCDVKLDEATMARLRGPIDWSAADAKQKTAALVREMAAGFIERYRREGVSGLGVYNDKKYTTDRAAEFKGVLANSPYLLEYAKPLHDYVERFPAAKLEGARDLFNWSEVEFGLKPVLILGHATIHQPRGSPVAIVASRLLYANHYFQAGLTLTTLRDAPGGGCHYMVLVRARFDPPTGMLAGAVRGKIASRIEDMLREDLKLIRAKLN